VAQAQSEREVVVEVRDVTTRFGDRVVHNGISLEVYRGEILAVVGGSGCGKSTLLREIVMLQQPTSGSIRVFGSEVTRQVQSKALGMRRRMGVLFQYGALFGGLTVLENVGAPIREHTNLSHDLIDEIAAVKIGMTGLDPGAGALYPSQLSGGMRKRAALSRAMALDPELLFLDEPSSGLDPISADALDELVLHLKASLGLTVVMVTHDMDSLWRAADRVILLGEGRILGMGTMEQLANSDDPGVQQFFQGPRARAARLQHA